MEQSFNINLLKDEIIEDDPAFSQLDWMAAVNKGPRAGARSQTRSPVLVELADSLDGGKASKPRRHYAGDAPPEVELLRAELSKLADDAEAKHRRRRGEPALISARGPVGMPDSSTSPTAAAAYIGAVPRRQPRIASEGSALMGANVRDRPSNSELSVNDMSQVFLVHAKEGPPAIASLGRQRTDASGRSDSTPQKNPEWEPSAGPRPAPTSNSASVVGSSAVPAGSALDSPAPQWSARAPGPMKVVPLVVGLDFPQRPQRQRSTTAPAAPPVHNTPAFSLLQRPDVAALGGGDSDSDGGRVALHGRRAQAGTPGGSSGTASGADGGVRPLAPISKSRRIESDQPSRTPWGSDDPDGGSSVASGASSPAAFRNDTQADKGTLLYATSQCRRIKVEMAGSDLGRHFRKVHRRAHPCGQSLELTKVHSYAASHHGHSSLCLDVSLLDGTNQPLTRLPISVSATVHDAFKQPMQGMEVTVMLRRLGSDGAFIKVVVTTMKSSAVAAVAPLSPRSSLKAAGGALGLRTMVTVDVFLYCPLEAKLEPGVAQKMSPSAIGAATAAGSDHWPDAVLLDLKHDVLLPLDVDYTTLSRPGTPTKVILDAFGALVPKTTPLEPKIVQIQTQVQSNSEAYIVARHQGVSTEDIINQVSKMRADVVPGTRK